MGLAHILKFKIVQQTFAKYIVIDLCCLIWREILSTDLGLKKTMHYVPNAKYPILLHDAVQLKIARGSTEHAECTAFTSVT